MLTCPLALLRFQIKSEIIKCGPEMQGQQPGAQENEGRFPHREAAGKSCNNQRGRIGELTTSSPPSSRGSVEFSFHPAQTHRGVRLRLEDPHCSRGTV